MLTEEDLTLSLFASRAIALLVSPPPLLYEPLLSSSAHTPHPPTQAFTKAPIWEAFAVFVLEILSTGTFPRRSLTGHEGLARMFPMLSGLRFNGPKSRVLNLLTYRMLVRTYFLVSPQLS